MKPTIGRIVIFNHPGVAQAKSPAIIQAVNEEKKTVSLWVFGPETVSYAGHIREGDGPFQWNWPKREEI